MYVSDYLNKRVHKFNQNLEFIKLLELEYEPFQLTILNSKLAVESSDDDILYFYDINSLNFNRKSNNIGSR